MTRFLFSASAATSLLFLILFGASPAGDKEAWKPFLPDDAHKTLTERSIKAIEDLAKADSKENDNASRIQVEAALLYAGTLSGKNADAIEARIVRGAALSAAKSAMDRKVKPLADFAKSVKLEKERPVEPDVKLLKPFLPPIDETMTLMRTKAKRGDGLPADLQYQPKLKNLNGSEALIGALAAKKLSDENLDKVAKELPLMGYRGALLGKLTHETAPAKNGPRWRELAAKMTGASIDLAEAAHKKNAAGIQKAATALENTCTQCHSEFKGK
jgi:hypothetical protein